MSRVLNVDSLKYVSQFNKEIKVPLRKWLSDYLITSLIIEDRDSILSDENLYKIERINSWTNKIARDIDGIFADATLFSNIPYLVIGFDKVELMNHINLVSNNREYNLGNTITKLNMIGNRKLYRHEMFNREDIEMCLYPIKIGLMSLGIKYNEWGGCRVYILVDNDTRVQIESRAVV